MFPGAAPAGAQCPVHAVDAVDTCVRCGNFVCGTCLEIYDADAYCVTCAARIGASGRASTRATTALVLGLIPAMTLCAPVGIAALVLGHAEIAAIDAGAAPVAGRNLAKGAVILGWINLAATILAVVIGLVWLVR